MTRILKFLAAYLMASLTALALAVRGNSLQLAATEMLIALGALWIGVCGSVIYLSRNAFWKYYARLSWPFWAKFTAFATIFALVEEAIAVSVNNYFYPITKGAVQLTASTDYWEVVAKHSVVALIPLFFLFSFAIKRFRLTPAKSFIYFGLIGVLAEATVSGAFAFVVFALWIFVYGLMAYLPSKVE